MYPQKHPGTLTTPEHTVELRGATLTWASKDKSSKKNVLEVSRGQQEGHWSRARVHTWPTGQCHTCPVHPSSGAGNGSGDTGDMPGWEYGDTALPVTVTF